VAVIAKQCGFQVSSQFETVGDLIGFGLPPRAVYLRGEQVSCDLSARCEALQEFILYRQSPKELKPETLQAIYGGALIPAFSENGAKRFNQAIKTKGAQMVLVCISDKVAKCFDPQKFNTVVVSTAPTRQAMIEKLAEYL